MSATTTTDQNRNPDSDTVPSQPRVSVIVPTFNRSAQLRALLTALGTQTLPLEKFEVIVCDDGSSEPIEDLVEETSCALGIRVCYLQQEHRGPGAARNLGIAHATAGILAFTDSDCIPAADWLEQLLAAFEDPTVHFIGGRVGFECGESAVGGCINYLMSTSFGAAGARDPRCRVAVKYYPRTPNLGVRSQLARDAGGFPEPKTLYGEDMAFSERVTQHGHRAVFRPECCVLHNEVRTVRQVIKESFRKGQTRVRIARRLGMHEWLHVLPAGFAAWVLMTAIALALNPSVGLALALPLSVYGAGVLLVALQGALRMKRCSALCLIPVIAPAIHFAYGAGYLCARIHVRDERLYGTTADWSKLLQAAERWFPVDART